MRNRCRAGPQPLRASGRRRADQRRARGDRAGCTTVLLRPSRLSEADLRRADPGADLTVCPAQPRARTDARRGRAGVGRPRRRPARRRAGVADRPQHAAADDPPAPRPAGRRGGRTRGGRLRAAPRPRLRHRADRHGHPPPGGSAARPRGRDARRLVTRASRGAGGVPRPCRCLRRGRPQRRTGRGAGRGPLASVAQPRRTRGEDRGTPPRLLGPARRA